MKIIKFNFRLKQQIALYIMLTFSLLLGVATSFLLHKSDPDIVHITTDFQGIANAFIKAIISSEAELKFVGAALIISYTSIKRALSCLILSLEGYYSASAINSVIIASMALSDNIRKSTYIVLSVSCLVLISAICTHLCSVLVAKSSGYDRFIENNEIKVICSAKSVSCVYSSLLACGNIILVKFITCALIAVII